jgi:hypothetical protein
MEKTEIIGVILVVLWAFMTAMEHLIIKEIVEDNLDIQKNAAEFCRSL